MPPSAPYLGGVWLIVSPNFVSVNFVRRDVHSGAAPAASLAARCNDRASTGAPRPHTLNEEDSMFAADRKGFG